MANTFNETFAGVTSGQTVTTANTSFDLITIGANGTIAGLAGAVHDGGARITTNTAGVSARENWSATATTRYVRVYIRIPANPANHMGIMSIRNNTTTIANVQISTTGALRIRNGLTLVATSTTTLTANTWYRLEWFWNGTGSTQTLRVYGGANLESASTHTEELIGPAGNTAADNSVVGILDATASGQIDMDEYAIDNAVWVGPASVTDTTWIRYASGGTWVHVSDRKLSGGIWN